MIPYRAKSWWHRERDKKILAMNEQGRSKEAIAEEVQLSVSMVFEILKYYRDKK